GGAAELSVEADGSAAQEGAIDYAGDVDVLRYVARATGRFVVRQSAGGGLDSLLTVLDASGGQIASNDDVSDGNLDSAVAVDLVEGQTYFLRAGAFRDSTGAYRLSVAPADPQDDFGGTFSTAADLVAAEGSGGRQGAIGSLGDVDLFRFVAPVTG